MFKRAQIIEKYQDKKGEWRWRLLANGRVMAEGGEGYATEQAVNKALRFMGVRHMAAKVVKVEKK